MGDGVDTEGRPTRTVKKRNLGDLLDNASPTQIRKLAKVLDVVSDKTGITLVEMLREGPVTVSALEEHFKGETNRMGKTVHLLRLGMVKSKSIRKPLGGWEREFSLTPVGRKFVNDLKPVRRGAGGG